MLRWVLILIVSALNSAGAALMTDFTNAYYCAPSQCLGRRDLPKGFVGPAKSFLQCQDTQGEEPDPLDFSVGPPKIYNPALDPAQEELTDDDGDKDASVAWVSHQSGSKYPVSYPSASTDNQPGDDGDSMFTLAKCCDDSDCPSIQTELLAAAEDDKVDGNDAATSDTMKSNGKDSADNGNDGNAADDGGGMKICCMAMMADCLSCKEGVTKAEYCKDNPETQGCEKSSGDSSGAKSKGPFKCCRALTAQCLACASGISVEAYCEQNADMKTVGCPPVGATQSDESNKNDPDDDQDVNAEQENMNTEPIDDDN